MYIFIKLLHVHIMILFWQWLHVPWLFDSDCMFHASFAVTACTMWLFLQWLHVPCLFWQWHACTLHLLTVTACSMPLLTVTACFMTLLHWPHGPCLFWQRLHVPCSFDIDCMFHASFDSDCMFHGSFDSDCMLHTSVTSIILEHILYYSTICSAYLCNILRPFGCVLYTYLSTFSILLAELFFMSHVRGSLLQACHAYLIPG